MVCGRMGAVVSPPAVRLREVTIFRRGRAVVDRLTGEFAQGRLAAIVGPNGSGKSSLMDALCGEHAHVQGTIERPAKRHIAYLPQVVQVERDFPISVFDFIAMGLWHSVGSLGGLDRTQREVVGEAIDGVGLSGPQHRLIGELSAGQLKRALFARVMVQDAHLVLLDEPFSGLDARTTADLLAVLRNWTGQGRTVIAVSHELDLIRTRFDDALVLARRLVAWGSARSALREEHLERARELSEFWGGTRQEALA